jgi:hypothetical protein
VSAYRVYIVLLCFWAGMALGLAIADRPALALVGLWLGKAAALSATYALTAHRAELPGEGEAA